MAKTCTYSSYTYNTKEKKALNFHVIHKDYNDLSSFEIDKISGCTVCREDQVFIKLSGIKPFRVCKKVASRFKRILELSIQKGQVIQTVTAYRVGKTRGEVDAHFNRTAFSNHSFGIAIDINEEHNGLYDRCVSFNENCHLRKGGAWHEADTLSLSLNSPLVFLMKDAGFKWGGEIRGYQKDFMHFSLTGY